MKTTIVILKPALILGLAAASLLAQAPARKSKWISMPPKTASQTPATNVPGLIRALAPAKANPADRPTLGERIATQNTLPGTWLIHVTPQGPDAPPPFLSISQFSAEGNFIETESDAMTSPATTPGQGAWSAVSGRSFDLTFYNLFFDGEDFAGTAKISGRAQLTLDGSSFKGTYQVSFFDPSGVLLFGGPGAFEGTRLEAEAH